MADVKPTCGFQGENTDDQAKVIVGILGIVGTAGTIIGILTGAAGKTLTILGVTGPGLVWLAAAGASLVTVITVFSFYYDRCLEDREGLDKCSAGVINDIVPSFSSTSESIFWFTVQHPRVDVVVKHIYWDLVLQLALYVKCAGDSDKSPILSGFYKSDYVCAIGLGSTIGAVVGGVVGILAGVAIAAAIGCTASGILYILCLILVMLIAAIVAVILTLIGAGFGAGIAAAFTEPTEPTTEGGNVLGVGDYVTTFGNLITYGNLDGARVYWFVERTVCQGRSTGSPQFSYTDPDANLTQDVEICERIVIE